MIVLNGLADPHQLLANHAPSADGEVANFGVTHLPVGQSHMGATGLNQGVGIGVPEGIHDRCGCGMDGVVLLLRRVSPAVKHRQYHWCHRW